MRIASAHGVPVVPRGAGSGLAGAANAIDGAITLVLTLMDAVLEVSTADRLAVVLQYWRHRYVNADDAAERFAGLRFRDNAFRSLTV